MKRTRWPDRETVKDWSQGVPLEKLQALVKYWHTDYDWRRCEAKLNNFPQYGSKINEYFRDRVPEKDAVGVAKLKKAGALLGRLRS